MANNNETTTRFKVDISELKKNFQEAIYTRAEKYAAITAIQRLKLNDYDKIRFVENYTGYKLS